MNELETRLETYPIPIGTESDNLVVIDHYNNNHIVKVKDNNILAVFGIDFRFENINNIENWLESGKGLTIASQGVDSYGHLFYKY